MQQTRINRRHRKQLARDVSKFNGNKIVSCLHAQVNPMVTDRKAFFCTTALLQVLSNQGFTTLMKLANNNKKRRNSIFFEPVVLTDMKGGRSTAQIA